MMKNQQGNALFITLILTLIMSLLVFAGFESDVSNVKMIESLQSYQSSFEHAESAMEMVFNDIDRLHSTSAFGRDNGFYKTGTAPNPTALDWSTMPTVQVSDVLPRQPHYFIEWVGSVKKEIESSLDITDYSDAATNSQSQIFRVVVNSTDSRQLASQLIEAYYISEL